MNGDCTWTRSKIEKNTTIKDHDAWARFESYGQKNKIRKEKRKKVVQYEHPSLLHLHYG